MMSWNDGLNGQALQIAATPNSPLCVVAGPGTGKTFALMRRLTRLLEVDHVRPKRVLACTFTRTAAEDITRAYTSAGRRDELLNLVWADVDFDAHNVTFAPKRASPHELAWQPKDHETRTIPIPRETVQLLANLQAESDEGNPYVFLTKDRVNHVVGRRAEGTWQSDFELVNNLTRDLEVMCRHAEVEYFTPHDLRRSCITNWARRLPIQTVQHLAGHSSIATTRKYYLAVLEADCTAAREIQSELMASLTNF